MKESVGLIDKSGKKTKLYIPTLTMSWFRYNCRCMILSPTTNNLLVFLAQAFEEIREVSNRST